MDYLIIGNGIAGLSAAEEIRKNDGEGRIIIIGGEKYLTYNRIKLSHFISKESYSLEDLLVRDENWYKERRIEVLLNTRVIELNTEAKEVITNGKARIGYDKLLIANGSRPFIPPISGVDKKGVFTLRTIDDLKEIREYIKKCNRVSIIGGGLLGLEAAWALKESGKKVNIVEFSSYLLSRQLDEELGKYLQKELEREGIDFYLNAAAEEIQGGKRTEGIRLKDGRTVQSDIVLISTGIRSNIEIAEGTDIKVDKGIIVDKYMRTNLKDIYAAGDIAQFDGVVFGLWSSALEQGKIAGANMWGDQRECRKPKSAVALLIGKIKMFSVGKVKDEYKNIKIHGENHFHKLFLDDGKIVGGVLIGDVRKMAALKRAVNENKDIGEMISSRISPEKILKSL